MGEFSISELGQEIDIEALGGEEILAGGEESPSEIFCFFIGLSSVS